ncbi:MAG: CinA family nicotinamide mononucleotide deamidase-related protein [Alteromonadaceae bacterium]|nr:CinA family nicotinamide mononucleotide deamidase-related protein [Alteromonadaceae bacterium]
MTGNELLSGDIVDSNSAMIAQALKALGIEIKRKVTISDDIELLTQEIENISQQTDILIINGGLGPTVDDMTAQAIALTSGKPLAEHPQALKHVKAWCKKRNSALNSASLKQTLLPDGCSIIANSRGSAVGIMLTHNNCEIYCTPGVPKELKVMINEEIIPLLAQKIPPKMKLEVTRLQVYGIGESSLQTLIDNHFPDWPDELELGFRATLPLLEVKLTSRSSTAKALKTRWLEKLKSLLGDHIINEISSRPISLAEQVLILLRQKNQQITTAESCTGGLIASLLTEISGSSQSFEAGFVTYSNRIKSKLLAVEPDVIEQHGAVSEATVLAMAQGALAKAHADVVIAVSGIAGPAGGTPDKPVGTVWIAWGNSEKIYSHCFHLNGERIYIQQHAAAIGLDLIRRLLINSKEKANYIK